MENYFNYFTEIEEHFQRRRATMLLLSTLDWALIETWKGAGIPLEAVLRGIDSTFESYERRPRKGQRKVNGLAYCSQEVLAAAEDMKEAAVGVASPEARDRAAFDPGRLPPTWRATPGRLSRRSCRTRRFRWRPRRRARCGTWPRGSPPPPGSKTWSAG